MKNLRWLIALLGMTLLTIIETKSVETPSSNTNIQAYGRLRLLTSSTSHPAQTLTEERSIGILGKVREMADQLLEDLTPYFWRSVSLEKENIPQPVASDPAEKIKAAIDQEALARTTDAESISDSVSKLQAGQPLTHFETKAFIEMLPIIQKEKDADNSYAVVINSLQDYHDAKKLFEVLDAAEDEEPTKKAAIALRKELFKVLFPSDRTKEAIISELFDLYAIKVTSAGIFNDPAFKAFIKVAFDADVALFDITKFLYQKFLSAYGTPSKVDKAIEAAVDKDNTLNDVIALIQIESWDAQRLNVDKVASMLKMNQLDSFPELRKVKAWATMVYEERDGNVEEIIPSLRKYMTRDQLDALLKKSTDDDLYHDELVERLKTKLESS
ncbi:hypothetical protein CCR75_009769 [Bremia lactucae]|uniref:RxLR effector protein n=1 Tax=Bremia lactucae TaxID=4779 RepID=A0A976FM67_BRELC|nr:hypothetical protein CCR75_009769 [Bremia lactucae]